MAVALAPWFGCRFRSTNLLAGSAFASPPATPKPVSSGSSPSAFDIVSHYNNLIRNDPSLTPPIAAIESLISLIATNPLTTISETLALLSTHSAVLLASQRNPIPLSAGTDLFQRYLVSSFQQRPSSLASADFSSLRNHLITNSQLFVQRAKEACTKIAHHALPFIKEDSTIFTYGHSRVTHSLLSYAAKAGHYFNVVYVEHSKPSASAAADSTSSRQISALRHLSIPTSTISLQAVNYALSSLPPSSPRPLFIVGSSAVLENGSAISRLGSQQLALIAQSHKIPFYVAVESYKFVRSFPLGYGKSDLESMGVYQDVFHVDDGATVAGTKPANASTNVDKQLVTEEEMIEIVPPALISALITENGIMTPNAVSEELIKLWF